MQDEAEEPPREVKAYQQDMPTEYGERRRSDNEVLRKSDHKESLFLIRYQYKIHR